MERQKRWSPEDLSVDLDELVTQWKYLKSQMDPQFRSRAVEFLKEERKTMQSRINVLDALGETDELDMWRKTAMLTDMQIAFYDSKEAYSNFIDTIRDKVDEDLFEFFLEIGIDRLEMGKQGELL